jgi:hypothetical protein
MSIDVDHLNYVPLVPFNGTEPNGGDSATQDLNIYYNVRLEPSEIAVFTGARAGIQGISTEMENLGSLSIWRGAGLGYQSKNVKRSEC